MFPLSVRRGWQAEETCSKLWWWSVNIYILKSLHCPASVYKMSATRDHTNDSWTCTTQDWIFNFCLKHFYQTLNHLEISNFSVTQFAASVVTKLDVPLAGQVVHQIWVLLDNCIENILISQAGCKHSNEILLSDETPQLTPPQFTQPLQLKKNYPCIVP